MGAGNADRFVRSVPQPNLIQAGNNNTGEGFKLASNSMNLLGSILDLAKANKKDKIAMTKAKNQVTLSYLSKLGEFTEKLPDTDPRKFTTRQKLQSLKARAYQHTQNGTDASTDPEVHLGLEQSKYDLFESDQAEASPGQQYGEAIKAKESKLNKQKQQEEKRVAQTEAAKITSREKKFNAIKSSTRSTPEQMARGFQAMQGKPQAEDQFNAPAIAASMTGGLVLKPKVQGVTESMGKLQFKSTIPKSEQDDIAWLAANSNVDQETIIKNIPPEKLKEARLRIEYAKQEAKNMGSTKSITEGAKITAKIAPEPIKENLKKYDELPSEEKGKVSAQLLEWARNKSLLPGILGKELSDKYETGKLTPTEKRIIEHKVNLYITKSQSALQEKQDTDDSLAKSLNILTEYIKGKK